MYAEGDVRQRLINHLNVRVSLLALWYFRQQVNHGDGLTVTRVDMLKQTVALLSISDQKQVLKPLIAE